MVKAGNWQSAAAGIVREAVEVVGRERLKALQRKSGARHALLVALWVATGAAGVALAAQAAVPWLWPIGVLLTGLFAFNGTVLLHEVLHGVVFRTRRTSVERILGLAYALPCAISPSQFTRWHLDHHAELGDAEGDPKRHHLSPKRNSRLVKLAYWTPALFVIYFRAAARETATYEPALRARIGRERIAGVAFHLTLAAALIALGSVELWLRVHALPLLIAFPAWFALNRLGQHYAIDPEDPACWGTLMKPSPWLWNRLFLFSNFHIEHHYFPGVPAYNLPRLHRALQPFFERHGMTPRTYRSLVWDWLVRNRPPHAKWAEEILAG